MPKYDSLKTIEFFLIYRSITLNIRLTSPICGLTDITSWYTTLQSSNQSQVNILDACTNTFQAQKCIFKPHKHLYNRVSFYSIHSIHTDRGVQRQYICNHSSPTKALPAAQEQSIAKYQSPSSQTIVCAICDSGGLWILPYTTFHTRYDYIF